MEQEVWGSGSQSLTYLSIGACEAPREADNNTMHTHRVKEETGSGYRRRRCVASVIVYCGLIDEEKAFRSPVEELEPLKSVRQMK